MPPTRRKFLLGSFSVGALPLLSGCVLTGDSSYDIVELEVVLGNGQEEPLTFQFALETTDGVGEWYSYEVQPNVGRDVTVEPLPDDSVAIRAAVDGYEIRSEMMGGLSGDVCVRTYVEYDLADIPTILYSTDVRC